jgi:hypothetical protein
VFSAAETRIPKIASAGAPQIPVKEVAPSRLMDFEGMVWETGDFPEAALPGSWIEQENTELSCRTYRESSFSCKFMIETFCRTIDL